MNDSNRIVITGIGLTAPNGNSLAEFRAALLAGRSGVTRIPMRYMGEVCAGICNFDEMRYQDRRSRRRGTRAGSISIYCANEAVKDSRLDFAAVDKSRVGVFLGITEHGNVETENEVFALAQYNNDVKYWTHHHNPRTVANNPAGEVTLNMGITGPHFCLGAACAAGNIGILQGCQQLILGEVDLSLAGGVSEATGTFGIFASFKSQDALADHPDPTKASRPFDLARNGIVVSEGGGVYVLERLPDARKRGAKIYAEIAGGAINSDASDFVLPNAGRQAECMRLALKKTGLSPSDINIISTHATATPSGDEQEIGAIRQVFANCPDTYINNAKSMIGHCMGAAGALELTGNLPAFEDRLVHPTINVDNLDPKCAIDNLVIGAVIKAPRVDYILNNSFGMLGINSALIVKRYEA
ncbi:MAG: beta-ketoacyl-[acyl-carrier-protein] synthase family protein [Candidatus Sumerlaeota bacterium]|nr:beta-ketoacyl-[acyl-carrier-protein] synthase family protein [Candidatus Sumerlaeota bacterium]